MTTRCVRWVKVWNGILLSFVRGCNLWKHQGGRCQLHGIGRVWSLRPWYFLCYMEVAHSSSMGSFYFGFADCGYRRWRRAVLVETKSGMEGYYLFVRVCNLWKHQESRFQLHGKGRFWWFRLWHFLCYREVVHSSSMDSFCFGFTGCGYRRCQRAVLAETKSGVEFYCLLSEIVTCESIR